MNVDRFLLPIVLSLTACGSNVTPGEDASVDSSPPMDGDRLDAADSEGGIDASNDGDAQLPAQPKWHAQEDDAIVAVAGDGQGGAYVVGDAATLQQANGQGVFIERYDSAGKSLFRRELYGLGKTTRSAGVALLADGTTVYSLAANGGIGFAKTQSGDMCAGLSSTGNALVLLRLGTNGDCLWAKRYGGYDNAPFSGPTLSRIPVGATPSGFAVAVPPLGNNGFSFEGVSQTATGEIVGRFTNAGAIQAVQRIDDANAPPWIIDSVTSDSSGNVYIAGRSSDTFHFDVNTTGWGVFVARYNPNLTYAWARFYGGWTRFGSVSGSIKDGTKIDVSGSVIGVLAPIDQAADFGVTKITPKANATAYAVARLATSDGAGQLAVGAYSAVAWDSTTRAGGIRFGSNGTLAITVRPDVEIDTTKYASGVVYAGFDAQLKTLWVKQYNGAYPVGIGSNPGQQTAVIAGHAYQAVDFGLGPLATGGFVVALGAP